MRPLDLYTYRADMAEYLSGFLRPDFHGWPDYLHQDLSVDEHHRGQGIGAALLAFAETWLHSLSARVCIVNSHIRRLDAHRFYEREGYQRTGHRFEKKWR